MTTFIATKTCYKSIHIINKESIIMISSHRTSILGTLFGLAIAISPLMLHAPVQAAPKSSYQDSCKDITINDSKLSAQCLNQAERYQPTSISIQGIQNKNGALNFTRLGVRSSYHETCTRIGVAGAKLSARCTTNDGSQKFSMILIPGIKNINGYLSY
jgi:CVNH domain